MTDREQFEAWWKTTGRALCGCSLVPDHTSPNQVFAARGFGAGFAAGFEAARAQPAQAGQVLTDDEVALIVAECAASAHRQDDFSFARAIEQAVLAKRVPTKLWLWKNFVNGRPEYWAFDNAFPVHLDCGDPQTLGEPCGYALFKLSRNARPEVSDAEVLRRVGIVGEKGGA